MKSRFAALHALLTLALSSSAAAQLNDNVRDGLEAFAGADFEAALSAFSMAENDEDLKRSDLLQLLETRALIRLARGELGLMERDLTRLAYIDPRYVFRPEAPPELRETFASIADRVGEGLVVDVDIDRREHGVRLRARVEEDPVGLVREVRLHARAAGRMWKEAVNKPLFVVAPEGIPVDYYVEVSGPGGAILAKRGSEQAPEKATIQTPAAETSPRTDKGSKGISPWVWVGIGVGVLAGATAGILLFGTRVGDDTQPGAPHF